VNYATQAKWKKDSQQGKKKRVYSEKVGQQGQGGGAMVLDGLRKKER